MKEKAIVSTATFVVSLLAYLYARETKKDVIPYLMIGGFLGSIVGETIAEKVKQNSNDNRSIS